MKRAIVRLVTFSLFQAGRFFARATRVLNHLAAGTLTIHDLRAGIERSWEEFLARDADIAAGLAQWEKITTARFVTRDDDVLLVGSGSGRDLVALVGDGYHVTGVEPARRATATCQRQLGMRGLTADVIQGFFEDVELPRRFDVIIFSGCSYSFIPMSRRRIAALRKAADHLLPHGRILVSYLVDQSGHPMLMRLARLSARLTGSDWRPERGDIVQLVDSAQPLFHYEHPFKPGEVEAEALAAGLRTAQRCDFPGTPVVVLESMTKLTACGEEAEENTKHELA